MIGPPVTRLSGAASAENNRGPDAPTRPDIARGVPGREEQCFTPFSGRLLRSAHVQRCKVPHARATMRPIETLCHSKRTLIRALPESLAGNWSTRSGVSGACERALAQAMSAPKVEARGSVMDIAVLPSSAWMPCRSGPVARLSARSVPTPAPRVGAADGALAHRGARSASRIPSSRSRIARPCSCVPWGADAPAGAPSADVASVGPNVVTNEAIALPAGVRANRSV